MSEYQHRAERAVEIAENIISRMASERRFRVLSREEDRAYDAACVVKQAAMASVTEGGSGFLGSYTLTQREGDIVAGNDLDAITALLAEATA